MPYWFIFCQTEKIDLNSRIKGNNTENCCAAFLFLFGRSVWRVGPEQQRTTVEMNHVLSIRLCILLLTVLVCLKAV